VLGAARNHWNIVGGAAVLGSGLVYAFYEYGGRTGFNDLLRLANSDWRFLEPGASLGVNPATATAIYAAGWALAFVAVATLWAVFADLDTTSAGYQYGDPAAIDVGELDAAGVRAAPDNAFAEMDEEESLALAQAAIDDDDPEKAQAILDRFDAVRRGRRRRWSGRLCDGGRRRGGSFRRLGRLWRLGGSGGDDGLMGTVQDRTSRASSTFLRAH